MKPCPWPVEALLPHSGAMILIDRIVAYDDQRIESEVLIGDKTAFLGPRGVPGYLGVEYIAQTIAAHAGLRGRERGQPPRIGFLLGTRQLRSRRGWFRPGDLLRVTATVVFEDEEMGAFDGRIDLAGEMVMEGRLNVYQPAGSILASRPGLGRPGPP